ncbi:MAG: S41 family peptidase [Candidatus Veblenbacteria bacterium]|nr:S41 family peptidase [Candidatus Veblenbacteria bacterium]MDZ4229514.1 S41 family peptidase [Candidatus Veblenbacteria bacterium]
MIFTSPTVPSLEPRPTRRAIPSTLTVILVILAFGLGVWVAQKPVEPPSGSGQVTGTHEEPPLYLTRDVDFDLFWEVWDYLHRNAFSRPLTDTKLFYGALRGLVAGLDDPYSIFMDPELAREFNNELEGTFDGIGAEIGIRSNNLVVVAPLPGTPAEQAGLKAGDRVLAIDGVDTTGMAVDYAVTLIRGQRGTSVVLTMLSNDGEPREVSIVRSQITIQVVESELRQLPGGQQVGYIKLAQFAQDTDQRFRAAWQDLKAQGANAIILDLRNNPGGFLDQAIALASHWAAEGVVVKEQLPEQGFQDYHSVGPGDLAEVPTVVLVNGGSASASEIVTGALQDWQLATVVGEKTFGKGSVQDLQEFPDGSAVKLTIAKWFTPKERSIDQTGLTPDIVVERTREDIEADKDPQLERAMELLGGGN